MMWVDPGEHRGRCPRPKKAEQEADSSAVLSGGGKDMEEKRAADDVAAGMAGAES